MLMVFPSFRGSAFRIWLLSGPVLPVVSPVRLVVVLCAEEQEVPEVNISKEINNAMVKKQETCFLFLLILFKKFFIKHMFI